MVVSRVLGAASVFRQGGSTRLILPKKSLKLLKVQPGKDSEDGDNTSTLILIETNKGILLRPLADYLKDEEMKEDQ